MLPRFHHGRDLLTLIPISQSILHFSVYSAFAEAKSQACMKLLLTCLLSGVFIMHH